MTNRRLVFVLLLVGAGSPGCKPATPRLIAGNVVSVGTFAAHYDAASGTVRYDPLTPDESPMGPGSQRRDGLTIAEDSTGVSAGAIENTSLPAGSINKIMGLVDPDSCSTDFNPSTNILSFYAKVSNKSNLPNDGAPHVYTDPEHFPPNTSFLSPFYQMITGFYPVSTDPGVLVSMNTTNGGISLTNNDSDANGWIDEIWPDKGYDPYFNYPHYDFTPYVPGNRLDPGDTTGCVLFMQFTLSRNESFTLYFDFVAVREEVGLPPTPRVTSHSDGEWVNTDVTLAGDNCTPGATVWIEGGASSVSTPCAAGGTFSTPVPLSYNAANHLAAFQVVEAASSGATSLTLHHDDMPPTVLGSYPSDGDSAADANGNCVITFSESMAAGTINSSFLQFVNAGTGLDVTGPVTSAADGTQAVVTPVGKPLAGGGAFECYALTGLTDLAGNALAATYVTRFTIAGGASGQDLVPPKVLGMYPPDNAPGVSPDASFTVDFDEPINPATIMGSVVDPACDLDHRGIPTVFVFELNTCNSNPEPVSGITTLDALGTRATFTPDAPLHENNCYGFVVTNCIADLSGNELPNRGERAIGAYNSGSVTYNTYNVFFTGSQDTTGPSLVSLEPMMGATGVDPRASVLMVFDEPIDPATVIGSNFFVTPYGTSIHVPLSSRLDPSLHVVTLDVTHGYQPSTTYVPTVTGNAADLAGNRMVSPQTGSFTTTSADIVAPSVVRVSPDSGGQVADKCPMIDIYFSEPMNALTLNQSTLQLIRVRDGTTKPTSVEVSDDGMHVRMVADSSLTTGTGDRNDWEIRISGDVEDRAGNLLGADDSRVFQVYTDGTVPSVLAVVPPNNGTIRQNGNVLIFFSEEMDKSTITATNIALGACTPIVFSPSDGRYAIANCINQWPAGSDSVTVSRNVRDFYSSTDFSNCEAGGGNRMSRSITSRFSVLSGLDRAAPTVSSLSAVNPQDGTTGVSSNVTPSVTFSEALDPRTVTAASVFLVDERGARVSVSQSLSLDARAVTLTPLQPLAAGRYFIVATTAVRDLGGGNPYDGLGGELVPRAGVLRTCFAIGAGSCP